MEEKETSMDIAIMVVNIICAIVSLAAMVLVLLHSVW